MQRFGFFVMSAAIAIVSISDVAVAARPQQNQLKECLERVSAKRQQAIKNGVPRSQSDQQWLKDVQACQRQHTNQAFSVPRRDRDPQNPKPWDARITDPAQCGDRVAVVDPETGEIKGIQVETAIAPAPGCRIIGRNPRDRRVIVGCGEIAHRGSGRFTPEPNDPPVGTGGTGTR